MARVIVKQAQLRDFLNTTIAQELERRGRNVLAKAKQLVPRASGDFANSLYIVRTQARGKPVIRIVSNDPNIVQIRKGTRGPYRRSPANIGRIQTWMSNVGLPATRSQAIRMGQAIAFHGTAPAGTHDGMTVDEAMKQAIKEVLR